MKMKWQQRAFTMVEMAIVIIIIGILTASLAPLLLRQHTNTMEGRDRTALEEAKTAIINYAISFGGIPDPVAGAMSAVPAFGVNNWGAFGDGTTNPFRLDVNDSFTSSYITLSSVGTATSVGGDRVVFCQAVNAQMTTTVSPVYPLVCQDYATDHVAVACPPARAVPAAFVLYSTGNDRMSNQDNNEVGITLNRIYENDKRGINNSPGTNHYDDQVMSYPASALARDCREKMGVAPEAMNCWTGRKALIVTNLSAVGTSGISFTTTLNEATLPPGSTPANAGADIGCTAVAPNGSSGPICQSRNNGNTTLNVYAGPSCTGIVVTSGVAAIDSNNDGIASVTVTGTAAPLTLTGQ